MMITSLSALLLATLTTPAMAQQHGVPCQHGAQGRDGLICGKAYDDAGLPMIEQHEAAILNATRGDLILTGGCAGEIGGLFAQLDPPQRYSHEGILTDDLGTRITHTTAAIDRYGSSAALQVLDPNLPDKTEGIDPETLKFGWPGGLVQPVMDAYEGILLNDPSQVPYHLDSFSSDPFICPETASWETQLVVTYPREYIGEPAGKAARAQLSNAADLLAAESFDTEAGIDVYPSHYRWYHYTNGALRDKGLATTNGLEWFSGNMPGASSTSIWSALSRAGVYLEGDELELDGHDVEFAVDLIGDAITPALQADLDPGQNLDGLYLYTEEERRRAATWMHGQIYDKAHSTMKQWEVDLGGEYTHQAATDAANQFVNCMAFDWCGEEKPKGSCTDETGHAKDSECWKDPGIGIAAAPEDFLSWDAPNPNDPTKSGVFGYSEPIDYDGGGLLWSYQWMPDEGTGMITGTLQHHLTPLERMSLLVKTVTGDEIAVTTCCDADEEGDPGSFTVKGIPAGPAEVFACFTSMPQGASEIVGPYFAAKTVDVVPTDVGATESLALVVKQQACLATAQVSEKTRVVTVSGEVLVIEDDTTHEDEHTMTLAGMDGALVSPRVAILSPLDFPATPYPKQLSHTFDFSGCTVDPEADDSSPGRSEIQMKVRIETSLVEDGPDINARVVAEMFEEESCPNTDKDKTWTSNTFVVPAGQEVSVQTPGWQINEEWPDVDRFRLQILVSNEQAPVPIAYQ